MLLIVYQDHVSIIYAQLVHQHWDSIVQVLLAVMILIVQLRLVQMDYVHHVQDTRKVIIVMGTHVELIMIVLKVLVVITIVKSVQTIMGLIAMDIVVILIMIVLQRLV